MYWGQLVVGLLNLVFFPCEIQTFVNDAIPITH
jgi:hypothetical protein